jgi:glycosyltransferase involved in cell wall biosynthesis
VSEVSGRPSAGGSEAAEPATSATPGEPRPRVLLLHNRYRAAGGEERVVDQLEALLRERGHAVARFERDSAQASSVQAARALLRGGAEEDAVAAAVRAHGADVVHAHNVHPLLGWRALAAARAAGARTVLHLHNYRLVCAIGIAYRDGAPCHRCHARDTRPGVRHRCRGSLPEAAVYATALAAWQPRLLANADALVAVSEAQTRVLDALGVPRARIAVVPNPVDGFAAASRAAEGTYALAAGRLVEDKGFDVAIRAARAAGVPLRIAGAGPDEPRLRALAAGGDVRFLGRLDREALARERRGAALLLAPSRYEDPCPMAVVEALADGLPVLASNRGGLPELVGAESVLADGDPGAWSAALRELWERPQLRAQRGAQALARARGRHAPDACYARLRRLYEPDGGAPVA